MSFEPFYKKYGVSVDPGRALVESQRSTGAAFKEALNSLNSLLDRTEKGYIDQNTINMQTALQDQIQREGLGAEAPDTLAIKKRFGNLIRMDDLNSTITGERSKLLTSATDQASAKALGVLTDTEDIGLATDAFRQQMLDLGVKESQIPGLQTDWRKNNEYRAADIKARDEKAVTDAADMFASAILQNPDLDPEEATSMIVGDAKDKLKSRIQKALHAKYEEITPLTRDAQEQLALAGQVIDSRNQAEFDQIDLEVNQAKAALQQMKGVTPGALSAVDELTGSLKGIPKAITDDSETTSWFKGAGQWIASKFNGKVSGDELANHLQTQVADLVQNYGLDTKTAMAIAVQAYQDTGAAGTDLRDTAVLNEIMNAYAGDEIKKKEYQAKINDMELRATARKQAISEDALKLKNTLLRNERKSVLTGGPYDPNADVETRFRSKVGGAQANKPADGSGVIAGYDITKYATDPKHEVAVRGLYESMPNFTSAGDIDAYIKQTAPKSALTGDMVAKAAQKYDADPKLIVAIMQQDSSLGTQGKGVRTMNPGNVGNDDAGNEVQFNSWEEGVEAVAKWLSNHKTPDAATAKALKPITGRDVIMRGEKIAPPSSPSTTPMPTPAPSQSSTATATLDRSMFSSDAEYFNARAAAGANKRPQSKMHEPAGLSDLFGSFSWKSSPKVKNEFRQRILQHADVLEKRPVKEQEAAVADAMKGTPEYGKLLAEELKKRRKA